MQFNRAPYQICDLWNENRNRKTEIKRHNGRSQVFPIVISHEPHHERFAAMRLSDLRLFAYIFALGCVSSRTVI